MGNPIAHSRSPFIHASFAEQTDRRIDYRAEWVAIDNFERWVADFFAQDGSGLNVTLPFKTRAFELADEASARAQSAGAANFLMKSPEGRVIADNTDGRGLVADMTAGAGWSLAGRRILVIGAGGAVKGVIPALLESSPQNILIVNRTAARAATLADGWRARAPRCRGRGWRPQHLAPGMSSLMAPVPVCLEECPRYRTLWNWRRAVVVMTWPMAMSQRPLCSGRRQEGLLTRGTGWACWLSRLPRVFTCGLAFTPRPDRSSSCCVRHPRARA